MHAIRWSGGLGAEDLAAARGAEAKDPKTAAALRFTAKIVDERGHLSAADVDTLRDAGFSDGEVAEIVFNLIAAPEIDFPVRTCALAGPFHS